MKIAIAITPEMKTKELSFLTSTGASSTTSSTGASSTTSSTGASSTGVSVAGLDSIASPPAQD